MNTQSGTSYNRPFITVDIIIEISERIVLIKRKNLPHGWALPGGFLEYSESLETAAIREAKEETCLNINLIEQFHTYSTPDRDPRHHTVTTVFLAHATGIPRASDDAKDIGLFTESTLPDPIVFDHKTILNDFFRYKNGESKLDIFKINSY